MGRVRGFLLTHRVSVVFRRVFRRRCSRSARIRLDPDRGIRAKPMARLVKWSHRLRTKAKAILQSGRGLMRVGQEPVLGKPEPIPKGHVAVYVGQKGGGDFQRVWVPVVYCNHPLFGDLLRESENEYGFNHPGGITIPCRISEFERVKTRIQAVQGTGRSSLTWKKTGRSLPMS